MCTSVYECVRIGTNTDRLCVYNVHIYILCCIVYALTLAFAVTHFTITFRKHILYWTEMRYEMREDKNTTRLLWKRGKNFCCEWSSYKDHWNFFAHKLQFLVDWNFVGCQPNSNSNKRKVSKRWRECVIKMVENYWKL